MISVAEALDKVLSPLGEMPAEQITLADGLGRVLAEDLKATVSHPPSPVSAMDGYAVRAEDLAAVPATLTQIGEAAAGKPCDITVGPGQCTRIFTGGVLPEGANAILIQENTKVSGDQVTATEAVTSGKFVRPMGLDFSEGDVLLTAGQRLTARDLGLAAAMNIPWLMVRRRPKVAVMSTGDEVMMPGEPLGPGQIVSSNSVSICAYVKALGGEALNLGIARDTQEDVLAKFQAARGADLIVTSGGASVGDYDIVAQVMGRGDTDLAFDKVAMRPGKPVISGKIMGIPLLGLPGNPVSSGVSSALYLRHAMDKMLGVPEKRRGPPVVQATLGQDLAENDKRQDYLRARLDRLEDGSIVAHPFGKQDSSMLAAFAAASGLVIRAPFAPAAKAGDSVQVMLLDMGVETF